VIIAVLSVPVLLLGTPLQFKMKENRMKKARVICRLILDSGMRRLTCRK
jgi:hypothetical protein